MPTPLNPPPASARRYDLDWLRTAAVFMLLPYHSSRIFDIWEPFYVKNAQTSAALTLIRAVLDPWGMPLLFVVAGAASCLALRRRNAAHYLRERTLRLLVPFLFGLVVLVPPQAYLAWLGQGNHGSYWHFFGQYWALHTGEFMGWTGGLTLGHLWFILFLFLFSLVALPLFLVLKRPAGRRAIGRLAKLTGLPGAILLLVVPFWLTEPLPGPMVGGYNPFAHLFLFIAGFVLIADPRFQIALDRSWRWALGLGTLTLAAVVAIRFSGIAFAESSWQSTGHDFLSHFTTWAWVVGLLGFGFFNPLPNLAAVALARELERDRLNVVRLQALAHRLGECLADDGAPGHQRPLAEWRYILADVCQDTYALNVTSGCNEHFNHLQSPRRSNAPNYFRIAP